MKDFQDSLNSNRNGGKTRGLICKTSGFGQSKSSSTVVHRDGALDPHGHSRSYSRGLPCGRPEGREEVAGGEG